MFLAQGNEICYRWGIVGGGRKDGSNGRHAPSYACESEHKATISIQTESANGEKTNKRSN